MAGKIIKAERVDFLPKDALLSASLYSLDHEDHSVEDEQKKTILSVDVSGATDSLGDVNLEKLRKTAIVDLEKEIGKRREKVEQLDDQIASLEARYQEIIQQRTEEAEKILTNARKEVEEKKQQAEKKAEELVASASDRAKAIVEGSEQKKKTIEEEMVSRKTEYEQTMKNQIEAETIEKVLKQSEEEIRRLIGLLEHIAKETIDKRDEIINSTHRYLVDISLTVAKKVVKKISQTDEELVLRNIKEALKNIKSAVRLSIRVNPEDWGISEKYQDHLRKMIEGIEEISILKDPTIERGGCVVETDLGVVDAKISSQLSEIELALEEVDPIRRT